VLIALAKLLGLLGYLYSHVFGRQFRSMIILITFHTEVSIFCDAVELSRLRRYFGTILAHRGLGLLFLKGIDHVVDDIDGQDLIIFKHHILMFKDLRVLVLIVKINRFKSFGAWDWIIYELIFTVAVGLTHRHLIHYTTYLLLCVFYAVEPHVENHTCLRELVALLAHLKQLISVVQLLCWQERFKDDTAFSIAAES
jgi:hypothetical protein